MNPIDDLNPDSISIADLARIAVSNNQRRESNIRKIQGAVAKIDMEAVLTGDNSKMVEAKTSLFTVSDALMKSQEASITKILQLTQNSDAINSAERNAGIVADAIKGIDLRKAKMLFAPVVQNNLDGEIEKEFADTCTPILDTETESCVSEHPDDTAEEED